MKINTYYIGNSIWIKRLIIMQKKKIIAMVLSFLMIFNGILCISGNTVWAFNPNDYKVSNPSSVGFYVNSATYSSKIETYAKKWNQCPELYLFTTSSAAASIKASVSGESTGSYATWYGYGNDNHSIVFWSLWQSSSDSVKNETVVHEFGHALGLAHTQSSNNSIAVMRATEFNGKAYPLSDDKAGIAHIY